IDGLINRNMDASIGIFAGAIQPGVLDVEEVLHIGRIVILQARSGKGALDGLLIHGARIPVRLRLYASCLFHRLSASLIAELLLDGGWFLVKVRYLHPFEELQQAYRSQHSQNGRENQDDHKQDNSAKIKVALFVAYLDVSACLGLEAIHVSFPSISQIGDR